MHKGLWGGLVVAIIGVVVACGMVQAQGASPAAKTVEGEFLGLSSGPLRDAILVDLPQGTVLRSGAVLITEQQIHSELAKAKPDQRASLERNKFAVLERLAVRPLLLAEARAWATTQQRNTTGESEENLIRAYLQSLTTSVTVSDAELQEFYQANKSMVGGVPFDTVKNDLRAYLLDQQRQEAVDAHIAALSAHTTVEVSASWTTAQAATALDTPVDLTRRSGKPVLVDFGRDGCQACDMMTPILEALTDEAAGRYTVLFVHIGENPILADRYGIQAIPTQIIYDQTGRELFRHVGFIPKAQLVDQLKKAGVN